MKRTFPTHLGLVAAGLTAATAFAALTTPVTAGTIGYWRMESGAFLKDSGPNGFDLTNNNSVSTATLGTSGAGSDFLDPIPLTGAANGQAGSFGANGNDNLSIGDKPAFAVQDFTIETMINWDGDDTTYSTQVIASQFQDATPGSKAWRLFKSGGNEITAQIANSSSVTYNNSGFTIAANTDYYVGMSVEIGDFGRGNSANDLNVTFYFQDLTNGGALQSTLVEKDDFGTLNDSSALFMIGANSTNPTNGSGTGVVKEFSGLIDEVRWSDTALDQSELLVVPEPSTVALVGLGGVILLSRRRRA